MKAMLVFLLTWLVLLATPTKIVVMRLFTSVTVLVMRLWLPFAIFLIYSLSCLVVLSNSARRIRMHQLQYIVAMALLFMLVVSRLRVMLSG